MRGKARTSALTTSWTKRNFSQFTTAYIASRVAKKLARKGGMIALPVPYYTFCPYPEHQCESPTKADDISRTIVFSPDVDKLHDDVGRLTQNLLDDMELSPVPLQRSTERNSSSADPTTHKRLRRSPSTQTSPPRMP